MFPLVKLLKIALPVATVTSATIATTFLVSLSKKDPKKKEQDIDEQLNDFKKPSEDFKDQKMYYSKDSNQKNLVALDQDLSPDLLAELEKKIKDLPSGQDLPKTREDIEKLLSSPSPESSENNDNARTSNIDMSQRGQDNDKDVLQSDAPLDAQKSNQSLKQDLSRQGDDEDDVSKQLVPQELNSKTPEDKESKDVSGDDFNDPQETKDGMLGKNSEIDTPTESVLQSQTISNNPGVTDNEKEDSPKQLDSDKINSENSEEGQSVSQVEGEMGDSFSGSEASQPEVSEKTTKLNSGDQTSSLDGSQENVGLASDQDGGTHYGSGDSENNLGVDSSGGEMTDEKLKELLNIKDQAEDLLGSLGQMLKIIS